MIEGEAHAIATVALIAALADGRRQDEERARLAHLTAAIGGDDPGTLTRRILAGQLRLDDVLKKIESSRGKRAAFELAASVCNADGVATEEERSFLDALGRSLSLDEAVTKAIRKAAERTAKAPLETTSLLLPVVDDARGRVSQAGLPAVHPDTALDDLILQSAIIAAGLELLPQGLATLLVLAIQARMVRQIGIDFGQQLDGQQVSDLARTIGLGAAVQVLEGGARQALSGAFAAVGGVAGAVAAAAFSFATTYALGHVAKRYYAQGRRISTGDLREMFETLRAEGRERFPALETRVREQAASLDLNQVLERLTSAG